MTQDTRAEKLRKLIADEDESAYTEQLRNHTASDLVPQTAAALKIFLTALHEHEVSVKYYGRGHKCWLCDAADKMIKEFS
jgi:hypothetical protein